MKTASVGDTLRIADLDELGATTAVVLRNLVRSGLLADHRHVEIDLSRARFVDSEGLGALVSVLKAVSPREGSVRLIGVRHTVWELFRLTRLDQLFEFLPAA